MAAIRTENAQVESSLIKRLSSLITQLISTNAFLLTAVIVGCHSSDPNSIEPRSQTANVKTTSDTVEKALELSGLHNLMKVSERIYSGSEPHGEQGFVSLKNLGIKTIVSVDGAKPQIDLARKFGIRYVHIPIGYDGVPKFAGESIARVVMDTQWPIYIHCHHGKHRGPAAAAVACIVSGEVTAKNALRILQRAGTSKDYAGLWRDVESFNPPAMDAVLPALVELAEVGSLAKAMAGIDRNLDNLKLCRDANWDVPSGHPDLVALQEALLVVEGLSEAARHMDDKYDEQFKTWLAAAETSADEVLLALKEKSTEKAFEHFSVLEKSCKQCHKKYRDQ